MRRGVLQWACLAALALPSLGHAQTTERVNVGPGGEQANGVSFQTAISADGRFVAFSSSAGNLVEEGSTGSLEAYVHDRATGMTELVSRDPGSAPSGGSSGGVAISADGRFILFTSNAEAFLPDNVIGLFHAFVYDRQTKEVELVSVNRAGRPGNVDGFARSISADGRFVAFDSSSSDLVENDTELSSDVFIRDRESGTTERISRNLAGGGTAFGQATFPSISAEGRFVAFEAETPSPVPGDPDTQDEIFLYDRQTAELRRISTDGAGGRANGRSLRPRISANGRFVAYNSAASNLVEGDTNGGFDGFVYDRETGLTERVTLGAGGKQLSAGVVESISADGRFVSFVSSDSDVAEGDQNNEGDVFVLDRETGEIERVGVDSEGHGADRFTQESSLSADGRFVAFESPAANLVPGDTNGAIDIFVRDRVGPTENPPNALNLIPESGSAAVVGTSHCTTAIVTDEAGTALQEVLVAFSVSGTGEAAGSERTDAQGVAQFCYTTSDLPGEDTITATAHGGSNPSDTATVAIVPPPSTRDCRVRYGGSIVPAEDHVATFEGFAFFARRDAVGDLKYQNGGPGRTVRIAELSTDAMNCMTHTATIFGRARRMCPEFRGFWRTLTELRVEQPR